MVQVSRLVQRRNSELLWVQLCCLFETLPSKRLLLNILSIVCGAVCEMALAVINVEGGCGSVVKQDAGKERLAKACTCSAPKPKRLPQLAAQTCAELSM